MGSEDQGQCLWVTHLYHGYNLFSYSSIMHAIHQQPYVSVNTFLYHSVAVRGICVH